MNFNKEDLLSVKDIELLITSNLTQTLAKMISAKLTKYCFIYEDILYELQPNITYQRINDRKNKLLNKVSQLIQDSYCNLSTQDTKLIELEYKKEYKAIFKNSNIELYLPQLLNAIEKKDIVFDITPNQIHYNNGYVNTQTGKFYKRTIVKHFITKCIKRDYKGSTPEEREMVLSHIRKVYPIKEDMDCILNYLGSALSWRGTSDQTALFLLGKGSTGKSFILELTKAVMECYFLELQSDTFSVNSNKTDKVLNSYKNDPQILFSWVNEPLDKKMNGSLFKIWVDGNLQTTLLYKDGQINIVHHSICITTANTMPVIIVEDGTTRRIISYTHLSKFTSDQNIVSAEDNVFLLDKFIVSKIVKANLLDAWFDILVGYCMKYMKNEKPKYTNNFLETKDTLISSSDVFQDFIDAKLIITKNETDKIGKDEMRDAFLSMYPDKHLTTTQVITSMKQKDIQYNCNLRYNNVRGAYPCIKFRTEEDEFDDVEYDNGIDKSEKAVTVSMEEYMKIKNELAELKKQMESKNKMPPLIFEEKKPTKKTVAKDENLDSFIDTMEIFV